MEFCYKTATVWQMVGKLIFILKIYNNHHKLH